MMCWAILKNEILSQSPPLFPNFCLLLRLNIEIYMKKLALTFLLLAAGIIVSAQNITHTYHFGMPTVKQVGEYQTLSFDQSVQNGTVGRFRLINPSKTVPLASLNYLGKASA